MIHPQSGPSGRSRVRLRPAARPAAARLSWSILDAMSSTRFPATAAVVIAFAVAMAYLESAVVVYLQRALGIDPRALFPVRTRPDRRPRADRGRAGGGDAGDARDGRLAGRAERPRAAGLDGGRLRDWDILYYAWLWVFTGWPSSLDTGDLLFLIPVPWAGPVWSPVAVSVALVGFGLAAARRLRAGWPVPRRAGSPASPEGCSWSSLLLERRARPRRRDAADYPWPVFAAGLALAAWGAATALRSPAGPWRGAPLPSTDGSTTRPMNRIALRSGRRGARNRNGRSILNTISPGPGAAARRHDDGRGGSRFNALLVDVDVCLVDHLLNVEPGLTRDRADPGEVGRVDVKGEGHPHGGQGAGEVGARLDAEPEAWSRARCRPPTSVVPGVAPSGRSPMIRVSFCAVNPCSNAARLSGTMIVIASAIAEVWPTPPPASRCRPRTEAHRGRSPGSGRGPSWGRSRASRRPAVNSPGFVSAASNGFSHGALRYIALTRTRRVRVVTSGSASRSGIRPAVCLFTQALMTFLAAFGIGRCSSRAEAPAP